MSKNTKETVRFTTPAVAKHRELADLIRESVVVDDGTASDSKNPSQAFEKGLPEGITMKQANDLGKYLGRFHQAARVAACELAAEEFIRNPKQETFTAEVGLLDGSKSRTKVFNRHTVRVPSFKAGVAGTERVKRLVAVGEIKATWTGGKYASMADAMSEEFATMVGND